MTLAPQLSAAAERNKGPILEVIAASLPPVARVLEIASGTGQHVQHFAAALPDVRWQPTEADAARRDELAARLAQPALANIEAPRVLDVERGPWPSAGRYDAVLCINMIHIAPWSATAALIAGAREVLAPQGAGLLILYGPYLEDGRHTAPSNATFDEWLRARDPAWGVRELGEVSALAARGGLQLQRVERLPANNLCVVFARACAQAR
jgi:SAM-dependent methyltransferase